MDSGSPLFEVEARKTLFRRLLPFFTRVLPAAFFKKPVSELNFPQLHNLIEGIFKPAGAYYTLSIASMLKSRYADRLEHAEKGAWVFDYSPKNGSLDQEANQGLFRAMRDGIPVLVLRQVSDKASADGSFYRLLGLGLVTAYDAATNLFKLRGMTGDEVLNFLSVDEESEELPQTLLKMEAFTEWQPFVAEEKILQTVSKQKRDQAFRDVVLNVYDYSCAVTGQTFRSGGIVEAEAAHIIAKNRQGTDNPKNGLALSRSVHWAFDTGIFTITDQYEVLINPRAKSARAQNFPLMEMDRKRILLPQDKQFWPHVEALEWHKKEVFERYAG